MGPMPLAGDFRKAGERNSLFPLAIDRCASCGILQVRDIVDHSVIFHSSYSYASSTVPGLVRHFNEYAQARRVPEGAPPKRLLEVGCNDGVFLAPLSKAGYSVVGVDASQNVVDLARASGLDVHAAVFGKKSAADLAARYEPFDVITCSNVFAHNPEVNDFVEGVLSLLAPNGEFWVEVHSAKSLFDGLQWDCFYHEHCFYWTIHSLARCLGRAGLFLKDWTTTPMHGGALRAVFSRDSLGVTPSETEVSEQDWSMFKTRCLRSKAILRDSVRALPVHYGYGAAGRAVTLINWSGIADELRFVVDGSPLRFGRVIPNTSVPVISEQQFFAASEDAGDWCFVTAHNYLDGIRQKVDRAFPARSMKYVTPLPHVAIS